jgi:hypothetical protein
MVAHATFRVHVDPDKCQGDPAAVTWSGGQVRGPRRLPVTILGGGG